MSTSGNETRSGGTGTALLIALAIGIFLCLLMPATMFWDRDEPYYARAAVEMLETGNWLVPYFNGEVFAHKPPLTYWLMAAAISIFGENEFGARFIAAPSMMVSMFLTFLIGRRLFSAKAGHVAMLALGLPFLSVFLGSAAMLDPVLLATVTLAAWAWMHIFFGHPRFGLFVTIFWIAMTLSMLAKGPVGPAVVIALVFFSWVLTPGNDRPTFARMLVLAAVTLIAFAIYLGWLIPANTASGGEIFKVGIAKHIFGRAVNVMEGHGGSGMAGYAAALFYYVPVVLIGFFPWTAHVPAAFAAFGKGRIGGRKSRVFVWSWLVPTFLMFTFAATKLPHYVFPLFPALALMAGAAIAMPKAEAEQPVNAFWFTAGFWLNVVMTTATIAALAAAPAFFPEFVSWPVGLTHAAFLLAALTVLRKVQRKSGQYAASFGQAGASLLFFLSAWWVLVPPIEPAIKLSKPLGNALAAAVQPGDQVYAAGYDEPSLIFYARLQAPRKIRNLPEDEQAVRALLAAPQAMTLVVTDDRLAELAAIAGERKFEILAQFEARNTNKRNALQKVLLARRPAAP